VGGGVGVVAASEVTVVRRDDRVGSALLYVLAIPLSCSKVSETHNSIVKIDRRCCHKSRWGGSGIPMHGPQALARTIPPNSSKVLS
jgi:hypothetical protein